MRRKIASILAIVLVLVCVCACGAPANSTTGTTSTTVTTEAPVPMGYTTYDNGDISFAYPADWVKTDGSVVILKKLGGARNNITVAYEEKNDIYDTFTVADFNSMMKPAYESMGMAVSNPSIEHKEVGGEKVNVISYTATASGGSMKQTQYIVNAGTRTYIITVTEMTADAALVNNVFNTIKVLK